MKLEDIKRNSNDFSFIDTIGSFIVNNEFLDTFHHYKAEDNERYGYIWKTLSSMGEDYAETIYENVINYIDNVSNVDLCKFSALQSMMDILGYKFDIKSFSQNIPKEVIDIIDILSINKSYLLNSKKFTQYFYEELSSSGIIQYSTVSCNLSDEIRDISYDDSGISSLSDYTVDKRIIPEEEYKEFLTEVYTTLLYKFIYLKYADAESKLSTENDYIYQYIQDDLIEGKNVAQSYVVNEHDKEINDLKVQYNLQNSFNPSDIVDNIENGYDSLQRYNIYEQKVLQYEIDYRQSTYSYDKTYTKDQKNLGYEITRYSYYREKKVREYFSFVEAYYSNLLLQDELNKYINDEKICLSVYSKDENYFELKQDDDIHLLTYDSQEHFSYINSSYIDKVAEVLATQTIQISEIREQIKLQMQKNYIKGTFLLLSYIVNEYMKYNILNNYGDQFYTDEDVSLGTIMQKSITEGDNVELVEYYDDTEYFNIQTDNDDVAKNGDSVNEKFWDNEFGKIGETTNDIPLEEIEEFYKKTLKLERYQVANVAQFLSAIFEYGKNTSFIYGGEDNENFGYGTEHGDFTCQLRNGKFIGDPYKVIEKIEQNILSIDTISSDMQTYIDEGYQIPETKIETQIDDYIDYLSTYYTNLLSSENQETKDIILNDFDSIKYYVNVYNDQISSLSSEYEALKVNPDYYKYYISSYVELQNAYLKQKLTNFKLSVEQGFTWRYSELHTSVDSFLKRYNQLSSDLYEQLFKLSVWQDDPQEYWPLYMPQYEDELTSVTKALGDYLNTQIDVNQQGAIDHVTNHYNTLNGYRSDLNAVLQKCIDADDKLISYRNAVLAGTGTNLTSSRSEKYDVWTVAVLTGLTAIWDSETHSWHDDVYELPTKGYDWEWRYSSYGAIPSSGVDAILNAISERCNFVEYQIRTIETQIESICLTGKLSKSWYDKEAEEKRTEYWDQWVYVPTKNTPHYAPKETKPYGEHYSLETEKDIKKTYDDAISQLKEKVELINSELSCIGFTYVDKETSIANLTRDNVGKKTKAIFQTLAQRITQLDDYIFNENKWKDLVSDKQLQRFNNRLIRIGDITQQDVKEYNIRYIDTTFTKLEDDIDDMFTSNSDYFGTDTVDKEDRLDKYLKNISSYIIQHDSTCSSEVYESIIDLISRHDQILGTIIDYGNTMYRVEISSIDISTHEYQQKQIPYEFKEKLSSYADALLWGDYADTSPSLMDYGMVRWISNAYDQLEQSIVSQIQIAVPKLPEYILSKYYAILARDKYLVDYLESEDKMTEKLGDVKTDYQLEKEYIESQISVYYKNNEIYLKYNGTDIGYDPYYNYKNQAYSSYQVHPNLYGFIEKSNLAYPLAKAFYVSFKSNYEQELVTIGLDNIIGKYGNVINVWKHGLYDYTGYKTKFEEKKNTSETNVNTSNANVGYTGLFYPPALEEFLTNREEFLQNLQDDTDDSYYKHLNLSQNEIERIINQLIEYEDAIREVAQKQTDQSIKPSLKNEYDIYKYCEDSEGNSLILLKSYKYLYEKNKDNPNYVPSYNEMKHAPGELWMRIKDHPIAFPAFDVREGQEDISQFNITKVESSYGYDINELVKDINTHFQNTEVSEITKDCIGRNTTNSQKQYLRCFFDMEIDATGSSLMLTVAYPTGTYSKKYVNGFKYGITFTYANSSIIVGRLVSEYDINNKKHIYSFTNDSTDTGEVDNIYNPGMIASDDGTTIYTTNSSSAIKYDFVGMHNNGLYVYAIFVKKYLSTNSFKPTESYSRVMLQLNYAYYRVGYGINRDTLYISDQKYDIFSVKKTGDYGTANKYSQDDYKYANMIVSTVGDGTLTLGFVSQRIQDQTYSKNSTIVNYIEYSNMLESNSDISSFGENKSYPRDTALLQTDDAEHVNIYNSFDSFTQYIVGVDFKFNGCDIKYSQTRYYNLHTDIGFLPVYADRTGTTRLNKNNTLKNDTEYNIELLGPEQTDVKYTPVIVTPTGEAVPNGRVTEDYKAIDKKVSYLDQKIFIEPLSDHCEYTWPLSDFFDSDEYLEIAETGKIFEYKYTLINTNYSNLPVLNGVLSSKNPSEYYYMGSELYDILSGEDIIGPNGITFQDVNMTNHINNISAIRAEVKYDYNEGYPESISLSCFVRKPMGQRMYIKENTFMMTVYVKNTLNSYKFYHILQNIDSEKRDKYLTQDELYEIEFDKIRELSSFELSSSDGKVKKPFENYSKQTLPVNMSALLNFKYSEEDLIDREFPYLANENIEDQVVILDNKEQYTFFLQLDDREKIQLLPFKMKRYYPESGQTADYQIDINQNKYTDFFDKTLKVEAIYNLEQNEVTKENEIVIYFNYKNYTSPCYYKKTSEGTPPKYEVCKSTDTELNETYLVLRPGQSGKIDLRYDFVYYDKLNDSDSSGAQDLEYSVVGKETKVLRTYYVINVSDSKPKFKISRIPFQTQDKPEDEDTYEMLDTYQKGTFFRYFKIIINTNRGGNYLSFSRTTFYDKENDQEFVFPTDTEVIKQIGIQHILGHEPIRLIEDDDDTYFLGTWEGGSAGAQQVELVFDMKSKCLDIEKYTIWRWYTSPNCESHGNFMPKNFEIKFSNDNVQWFSGNSYDDYKTALPCANYVIAYGRPSRIVEGKDEGYIEIQV